QTELIAVPPAWTVGQVIDHLRETADLPDRFWEFYVVDPDGRLRGAVALDRLLRTKRPVPIEHLLEDDLHPVEVTEDRADVARLFEHYDLVSAPVWVIARGRFNWLLVNLATAFLASSV